MKSRHCPYVLQLQQRSDAPARRSRRLLIALGAGTLTTALAGALTGASAAHAQGSGPPARIGFIVSPNATAIATRLAGFRQGMRENALIEGQHYVIDAVYADGQSERFPALAQELLQRAPAVIMVSTIASVRAAQQATRTVPIVMTGVNDPVGTGLVASLARPGGNTTGQSSQNEDLTAKFVEFVREALPRAKRIALLTNPTNASLQKLGEQVRVAALKFGLETRAFEVATPAALDAAFAAIARQQPDALVVLSDAMLNAEPQRISAFALKNRIAAFGGPADFAEAGSLLAYGASGPENFRRSATYVRKILAGAKPADLPIEQPIKFEMVINLKTARALGLAIPKDLLLRADKIIE